MLFLSKEVLYINVLSNVDLAIPYTKLDSLAQVVKASKTTSAIDDDNDTLTVTIVAMDELSVQIQTIIFLIRKIALKCGIIHQLRVFSESHYIHHLL